MGILERFTKSDTGNTEIHVHVDGHKEDWTISDLLNKVFTARKRLKNHISGKQDDPDIDNIGDHHACKLGRWLYNEGKEKYSHLDEFENFRKVHKKYHRCAENVVELYNEGETKKAKKLLNSEFARRSNDLKESMVKLFKQAETEQNISE